MAQSNKSNLIRVNIQRDAKPAILQWVDGSIAFTEPSGNNIIDANEECSIRFSVKNAGMADAHNCIAKIEADGMTNGITFANKNISKIAVGETVTVDIPITASQQTQDGQVTFRISMYEPMGFGTNTKEMAITTRHFIPPMLRIVDHIVTGENGKKLQKILPTLILSCGTSTKLFSVPVMPFLLKKENTSGPFRKGQPK
jgi:hypothetical protein